MELLVKWVVEHMHELFSGAGVVMFTGVVALIRGGLSKRAQQKLAENARIRAREQAAARVASQSENKALDPAAYAAWAAYADVPQHRPPESKSAAKPRYCSFCRKSENSVEKLVAGPGVNICNDCLNIGLDRLDSDGGRRARVLRLNDLTYSREKSKGDEFVREHLQAEIDELAMTIRRRRREGRSDIVAGAELIRTVGAGNFSTVWEARVKRPTGGVDRVAVKIFDQDKLSLGLMLWRFQRGLRALQHFKALGKRVPKCIIALYEISEDRLSFSMPFLPGGDLQNLKARHLSLTRRIELFRQVSEGTSFAHSEGIIHRDIKPANIVLDGDGDAVLTDFDIADITFARTQSIMAGSLGTPQFAAPEQLLALTEDGHATSDVYSLGKLLVFLITQESPPLGSVGEGEMPDWVQRDIPEVFRKAVVSSLQADPANRPQDVRQLLALIK